MFLVEIIKICFNKKCFEKCNFLVWVEKCDKNCVLEINFRKTIKSTKTRERKTEHGILRKKLGKGREWV